MLSLEGHATALDLAGFLIDGRKAVPAEGHLDALHGFIDVVVAAGRAWGRKGGGREGEDGGEKGGGSLHFRGVDERDGQGVLQKR